MAVIFPANCKTPAQRTEYCYRAQELLRLLHNRMGEWHRDGLTQSQWNQFPQKIKDRYSYMPQLSDADWRDFILNVFEPIEGRIVEKLLNNRQLLFQSTTWTINVEDI